METLEITIEENNILLAEFMEFIRSYPNIGLESQLSKMYRYGKRDKIFPEGLYTFSIESLYGGDMGRVKHIAVIADCEAKNMPFNKSWDWLMPVVEKIEKLEFDFAIYTGSCVSIINTKDFPFEEIISLTGSSKIQAVYSACVEFVKWYNEQSK